jgi:hypothetical protein
MQDTLGRHINAVSPSPELPRPRRSRGAVLARSSYPEPSNCDGLHGRRRGRADRRPGRAQLGGLNTQGRHSPSQVVGRALGFPRAQRTRGSAAMPPVPPPVSAEEPEPATCGEASQNAMDCVGESTTTAARAPGPITVVLYEMRGISPGPTPDATSDLRARPFPLPPSPPSPYRSAVVPTDAVLPLRRAEFVRGEPERHLGLHGQE